MAGDRVKPVCTPGLKPLPHQIAADKDFEDLTRYRGIAARANYLSADRPDLQFAAKEACRHMSRPTREAWQRIKRIGRYLVGKPRIVQACAHQALPEEVVVIVNSDWAGRKTTRKSTTGGVLRLGSHVLEP